jgi:hypothetical protein
MNRKQFLASLAGFLAIPFVKKEPETYETYVFKSDDLTHGRNWTTGLSYSAPLGPCVRKLYEP